MPRLKGRDVPVLHKTLVMVLKTRMLRCIRRCGATSDNRQTDTRLSTSSTSKYLKCLK